RELHVPPVHATRQDGVVRQTQINADGTGCLDLPGQGWSLARTVPTFGRYRREPSTTLTLCRLEIARRPCFDLKRG
ncbi:hypothetical protein, partial [Roseibium sp. RKSG952]|uniref:hypothetical protein n=1 Tax=Roseibium sp. RKSG952 TaxID=2529384 RepID=UPI001AD93DC8